MTFLLQMYGITLQALKAAKNERMWFIVSMKLARLHVDARRLSQACALINELHRWPTTLLHRCCITHCLTDVPVLAQLLHASWNRDG